MFWEHNYENLLKTLTSIVPYPSNGMDYTERKFEYWLEMNHVDIIHVTKTLNKRATRDEGRWFILGTAGTDGMDQYL